MSVGHKDKSQERKEPIEAAPDEDWMDYPCLLCGHRLGAHRAIVGWMGEGCPTEHPTEKP